jgi:hypothetical protein
VEERPGETDAQGRKERLKDGRLLNLRTPREVSTGPVSDQEEGDDPALGNEPSSEEDFRLPFMEIAGPDGPPKTEGLTGQFGTVQLGPHNLQNARDQVEAVDGELLPVISELCYPQFTIKPHLLYQVVKHNVETKYLLLLPTQYVNTVLQHRLHPPALGPPGDGENQGADWESFPLARSKAHCRGLLPYLPGVPDHSPEDTL